MSKISTVIGQRIRNTRLELGMSREVLAEKADLNPGYLGQLERGEKNATLVTIEKVAVALGISYEEIFENLTPGKTNQPSPAAKCYELIDELTPGEQELALDILRKIILLKKS